MKLRQFTVPKYETNEDKWHIPQKMPDAGSIILPDGATGDFDERRPVVLCDGASESYASSLWASILASNFHDDADFTNAWLENCIEEYEKQINPENLSWSRQLAYERGSFATFLSAQFKNGQCLIRSVGDSCAFFINGEEIIGSCLYENAEDFLQHPVLLSTKPELNPLLETPDSEGDMFLTRRNIKDITHILLLTDAIAHWLMKRKENTQAIRELLQIETSLQFRNFVEKERNNDLRFDDTTMIRIELAESVNLHQAVTLPALREI